MFYKIHHTGVKVNTPARASCNQILPLRREDAKFFLCLRVLAVRKSLHENVVAQASGLFADKMSALRFHHAWVPPRGMAIPPE
jgi:hypothetical protein